MGDKRKHDDGELVNLDAPVFDLRRVSWGDSRRLRQAQAAIRQAVKDDDLAAVEAGMDAVIRHLALCVVHVPAAWLVEGAPEALNWQETEAYDWLQEIKMQELIRLLVSGTGTESASGN